MAGRGGGEGIGERGRRQVRAGERALGTTRGRLSRHPRRALPCPLRGGAALPLADG
jgi:hypothetical protein